MTESEDVFSYAHFKYMLWLHGKGVLHYKVQDGFQQKLCGSIPEHVIMDATALAHRKDFKVWTSDLESLVSEQILYTPYWYL